MKTATVHEIKQELSTTKPADLVELCLRLARFKKENKELLTYLLFEAHNEQGYIESVKKEISELFAEINQSNVYYAKKSLRKIIRIINKYCRYSGVETNRNGITHLLLLHASIFPDFAAPKSRYHQTIRNTAKKSQHGAGYFA